MVGKRTAEQLFATYDTLVGRTAELQRYVTLLLYEWAIDNGVNGIDNAPQRGIGLNLFDSETGIAPHRLAQTRELAAKFQEAFNLIKRVAAGKGHVEVVFHHMSHNVGHIHVMAGIEVP